MYNHNYKVMKSENQQKSAYRTFAAYSSIASRIETIITVENIIIGGD